ncbi:hypothetical protein V7S43_007626 [Phytophthora oleae]|uniref:Uncharacterized protein n=1 Tax=Phytophthora oleae TaxID=2107226 RepID=A0ABD3FNQ2_9STRA
MEKTEFDVQQALAIAKEVENVELVRQNALAAKDDMEKEELGRQNEPPAENAALRQQNGLAAEDELENAHLKWRNALAADDATFNIIFDAVRVGRAYKRSSLMPKEVVAVATKLRSAAAKRHLAAMKDADDADNKCGEALAQVNEQATARFIYDLAEEQSRRIDSQLDAVVDFLERDDPCNLDENSNSHADETLDARAGVTRGSDAAIAALTSRSGEALSGRNRVAHAEAPIGERIVGAASEEGDGSVTSSENSTSGRPQEIIELDDSE